MMMPLWIIFVLILYILASITKLLTIENVQKGLSCLLIEIEVIMTMIKLMIEDDNDDVVYNWRCIRT